MTEFLMCGGSCAWVKSPWDPPAWVLPLGWGVVAWGGGDMLDDKLDPLVLPLKLARAATWELARKL